MNMSGRLALIKPTLNAMTIYTSICIGFPPLDAQNAGKITKAFPWVGSDEVQGYVSATPNF
jgi:hypothetical protein